MFRRDLVPTWIAVVVVSGLFLMGQDTWPPPDCVEFEDSATGSVYVVGNAFMDSGTSVQINDFQLSDGSWFSGGYAEIIDWDCANDDEMDHDLLINNVNAEFDFPTLQNGLELEFAESGGNVNIQVNGMLKNAPNLIGATGSWGDVNVMCSGMGCFGVGNGTLKIVGKIRSFSIGGQEFRIDNVCPIP